MTAPDAPPTWDTLLGGRVTLLQPSSGYRAAIDPVLLAAAVEAPAGGRAVELGSGTGAASLCLAARRPDLRVAGLERDRATLALARESAALSGLADRVTFHATDLEALPAPLADGLAGADAVLMNPPYLDPAAATPPPDPGRAAAHAAETPLAIWLRCARRLLRPGGRLTAIHRADALPALLAELRGFGGTTVRPVRPRGHAPAARVIVAATLGSRAPFALLPDLILHGPAGGAYTEPVEAVLRHAAALP